MFARLENALRERGQGSLANIIASVRHLHGGEIYEGQRIFTLEQRQALEHYGYAIYSLTGQTIYSLYLAGNPYKSIDSYPGNPSTPTSLNTEVAINPDNVLLEGSDGNTYEQQVAMIAEYGERLGREIHGVTAIVGSVVDYAELAFTFYNKTEQRLFGAREGYAFTRTTTQTADGMGLLVGRFGNYGLTIETLGLNHTSHEVYVTPLVVPV